LAINLKQTKKLLYTIEPTAAGDMGANNISRFKKLIDKLVEIQSTPKGIRCGVSSAIPATMLGCGSRIRGMDCRYWPGAPALPAKYSEQLDLVD